MIGDSKLDDCVIATVTSLCDGNIKSDVHNATISGWRQTAVCDAEYYAESFSSI